MSAKGRRKDQQGLAESLEDHLPLPGVLHLGAANDEKFWKGCPDPPVDADVEALQHTVTIQNSMELQPWLTWMCTAVARDPAVYLAFSPALTKHQRARIHKTTEDVFGRDLDAVSSGLGEHRAIIVCKKGMTAAVAYRRGGASPAVQQQAQELHRWLGRTGGPGSNMSLDEITEALATEQLPEPLKVLQSKLTQCQPELELFIYALAADDLADIQDWVETNPEIVTSGMPYLGTGELPLQAAARIGCLDALRVLVAAGAPLEAQDMKGRTPLQAARAAEQTDAEAVLLQLGAVDPDDGDFPLPPAAAAL